MHTQEREYVEEVVIKKPRRITKPLRAGKKFISEAGEKIEERHGKKAKYAVGAVSLLLTAVFARGASETLDEVFFAEERGDVVKGWVGDTASLPISLAGLGLEGVDYIWDNTAGRLTIGVDNNGDSTQIFGGSVSDQPQEPLVPLSESLDGYTIQPGDRYYDLLGSLGMTRAEVDACMLREDIDPRTDLVVGDTFTNPCD